MSRIALPILWSTIPTIFILFKVILNSNRNKRKRRPGCVHELLPGYKMTMRWYCDLEIHKEANKSRRRALWPIRWHGSTCCHLSRSTMYQPQDPNLRHPGSHQTARREVTHPAKALHLAHASQLQNMQSICSRIHWLASGSSLVPLAWREHTARPRNRSHWRSGFSRSSLTSALDLRKCTSTSASVPLPPNPNPNSTICCGWNAFAS